MKGFIVKGTSTKDQLTGVVMQNRLVQILRGLDSAGTTFTLEPTDANPAIEGSIVLQTTGATANFKTTDASTAVVYGIVYDRIIGSYQKETTSLGGIVDCIASECTVAVDSQSLASGVFATLVAGAELTYSPAGYDLAVTGNKVIGIVMKNDPRSTTITFKFLAQNSYKKA